MPRVRKLLLKYLQAFLLFISGILVATFFFGLSNQSVQALMEKVDTSVRYEEELYRVAEGIPYQGIPYQELERQIRQAKKQILCLTVTAVEEKQYMTNTHASRIGYLRAIEKLIENRHEDGFTYMRILQIPPKSRNVRLGKHAGVETLDHCRRVLDLNQQFLKEHPREAGKLSVVIKKVFNQSLLTFVIIDNFSLIIEVTGIISDGTPYVAGYLFIEDKIVVQHFQSFFNYVSDKLALPVAYSELT